MIRILTEIKKLIGHCVAEEITIIKMVEKYTKGYVGKDKGAIKTLFERVFCDQNQMLTRIKTSVLGKEIDEYLDKYKIKNMQVVEIKSMLKEQDLPVMGNRDCMIPLCCEHGLSIKKKISVKKRNASTRVYNLFAKCEDFKTETSRMEYILKEKIHVKL